jgi:hypothetical protein
MKRLEWIGLGKLEEMQNFDEGFIVLYVGWLKVSLYRIKGLLKYDFFKSVVIVSNP